jgi:ribosomal protein S18 acetylase RimI-like enzyme
LADAPVADSAQLIGALERNLWSMWRALGNCPGGRVTDSPTRLLVETPLPQAPYNSVFRFLDDGTRGLQEQVDDVLALYESRPVTLAWVFHPTSPPAVRDCLAARGLVMAEEIHGMAAELADLDLNVAPARGVEIVEATAAHSAEWMELATVRFGLDATGSSMVKQLMEDNIDHAHWFLAKVDGVPLSKAVLHITGDLAGIYAVATAEEGRGRGLAKALTKHALATARDSGCQLGLLHSTPMAREMYRSLGFRDVATFELWAEPDRVYL